MILGKEGVKIVSGYTEVIARIILAGKSAGVHSFFPVHIKMQEHFIMRVHSFLPVNNREPRVQWYTLSFQCVLKCRNTLVWGYTLSCLLITGSQKCRGTLFLSGVYLNAGTF